jgi:hypothetical protein
MLPLYEAKLIYYFDHRYGDYRNRPAGRIDSVLPRLSNYEKSDPDFVVTPLYWVQEFDTINKQKSKLDKTVKNLGVSSRLHARLWEHSWLLAWRAITNNTNERTMISSVLPLAAVGHGLFIPLPAVSPESCALLYASLSSFVLDFVARQKIAGTNMSFFLVKQLPVLPPEAYEEPVMWLSDDTASKWIRRRALELSFTTWELQPFARELRDEGPPFRWDEERRSFMRAELDAAYFHLYGLERDEVEHVMDSFDTLRRREEKPHEFGEFRTKRLILECFDAMAEAVRTGVPYQTILDPPPGHGPRYPARRNT